MFASDPHASVIPSFRLRAARYQAELARMVTVLQITEPWGSPRILRLLRDAELMEHGLFTLAHPGDLTDDEQRFVVERLLPFVPDSFTSTTAPSVTESVPVSVSAAGRLTPGQTQLPVLLSMVTGTATPPNAVLTLLRGNATVYTYSNPQGGSYQTSFSDAAPGAVYTAQLTYQGRLLGQATVRVATAAIIRYGVQPRDTALTADYVQSLSSAALQPTLDVVFALASGRGNLLLVVPPGMSVQIQDPRTQAFFTNTFSEVVVEGVAGTVLRQSLSSVGPLAQPAHLIFS
jgi:hypothetical protein